jgi:hypothetical protein
VLAGFELTPTAPVDEPQHSAADLGTLPLRRHTGHLRRPIDAAPIGHEGSRRSRRRTRRASPRRRAPSWRYRSTPELATPAPWLCFDAPPAAPPLAVVPMPVGGSSRAERLQVTAAMSPEGKARLTVP